MVLNGHVKDGTMCRECAMTFPCHAWLLANEIVHPIPVGTAEPGALREALERATAHWRDIVKVQPKATARLVAVLAAIDAALAREEATSE